MTQRFTQLLFSLLKRVSPVCFLVFWVLWLTMPNARAHEACMLIPLSLEERVQAAELVVEGKVISQRSFWDDQHQNIYTAHQVEVFKVFKGQPAAGTVEVITEGGRVDMDLHVYSATLQLKPQQQGVFFLQPTKGKAARYTVFGSMQGFIRYKLPDGTARDPFTRYGSIPGEVYGALTRLSGGTMRTVSSNPALEAALKPKPAPSPNQRRLIPLISAFSPQTLRAGTGDVLTINGTNFGNTRGTGYVEFRDADDGGASFIRPLPTDYVSWTDTEIRVRVPSYGVDGGTAGSGTFRVVNADPNTATSLTPLTIIYAHSNVGYDDAERNIPEQSYQPRLINQNGQGGYTFRFGASFENNTPALYAFKRSMNEWSCNTFINWNTASNAPVATTADDNINSVRFTNAGELPNNVLGRCISRYRGCGIGTNFNFWVKEMDLEFALRSDWQYGPAPSTNQQFDFQSVVVHELGHGHQLSHLILPRAIMHYAVARGLASRTLNPASDIEGGQYVMARSAVPFNCNVALMVPKPANACAIPVELIELTGELTTDNRVLLQWNTQQEVGITEFVVERSQDGVTFTSIGTVPASGNSTTPRAYQFTDPAPFSSLNYYRLRLVKSNNTVEYSEVVQVLGPGFVRQLAPNPGGAQTSLYFNTSDIDRVRLTFYDLAGREYAQMEVAVSPASNRYEITLPLAGAGLFLVKWESRRESGVFRYVKLE